MLPSHRLLLLCHEGLQQTFFHWISEIPIFLTPEGKQDICKFAVNIILPQFSKIITPAHALYRTCSACTSRGMALFVSTSLPSILCGLLAWHSSSMATFSYVMKPKPLDLRRKKISIVILTQPFFSHKHPFRFKKIHLAGLNFKFFLPFCLRICHDNTVCNCSPLFKVGFKC